MLRYWESYADDISKGRKDIIMCHAPGEGAKQSILCGYAVLSRIASATGPLRAEVLKLLVPPTKRRLVVTRCPMQHLAGVASRKGLTLLVRHLIVP